MTAVIDRFQDQYGFLSNFHPSPLTMDGIFYPTAEHAFQAWKSDDRAEQCWVAEAPSPGAAKRRGRQVRLSPDWERLKTRVMVLVLAAKFEQNPDLARQLVATGDVQLVEGNWWHDQFWGDCFCPRHQCCRGENWLGKLLMELRDCIRVRRDDRSGIIGADR